MGKGIFILGLILAGLGLLLWLGGRAPWLGRLPGDIRISRPGFSLHFPLATCLLLSAALSLVLWLFRGRR